MKMSLGGQKTSSFSVKDILDLQEPKAATCRPQSPVPSSLQAGPLGGEHQASVPPLDCGGGGGGGGGGAHGGVSTTTDTAAALSGGGGVIFPTAVNSGFYGTLGTDNPYARWIQATTVPDVLQYSSKWHYFLSIS